MPELPEVYNTACELNQALQGKTLTNIVIVAPSKCKDFDNYSDELPAKLEYVTSKGKKLLFQFENFIIGSFLGMEGRWSYEKRKHLKLYLEFEDVTLYYDDSRCFGNNTMIRTNEQLEDFLKAVGIDLLRERDQVTPELWRKEMRNARIKNKQICDYLLEQHRFAGIGNYLRAEILYQCKISPFRKLCDLTEEEVELLRTQTLNIIDESTHSNGLTIATYKTPNGVHGTFERKVYNQSHDPLGNPVIKSKTKTDGRMIHWCPTVQK